jgi:hypothetical protein
MKRLFGELFSGSIREEEVVVSLEPNVDIAIKRFVHTECANPYEFIKSYMDLEKKATYSAEDVKKGKRFYFTLGNHPDHHEQGSVSQQQAQAMSEKLDTICTLLLDPLRKQELDAYLHYYHNQDGNKIPFVESSQNTYSM